MPEYGKCYKRKKKSGCRGRSIRSQGAWDRMLFLKSRSLSWELKVGRAQACEKPAGTASTEALTQEGDVWAHGREGSSGSWRSRRPVKCLTGKEATMGAAGQVCPIAAPGPPVTHAATAHTGTWNKAPVGCDTPRAWGSCFSLPLPGQLPEGQPLSPSALGPVEPRPLEKEGRGRFQGPPPSQAPG